MKKKKIKLGLSEEAEWEDYFEAEKAKAQTIQSEIDKTDKVYISPKLCQPVRSSYAIFEGA